MVGTPAKASAQAAISFRDSVRMQTWFSRRNDAARAVTAAQHHVVRMRLHYRNEQLKNASTVSENVDPRSMSQSCNSGVERKLSANDGRAPFAPRESKCLLVSELERSLLNRYLPLLDANVYFLAILAVAVVIADCVHVTPG